MLELEVAAREIFGADVPPGVLCLFAAGNTKSVFRLFARDFQPKPMVAVASSGDWRTAVIRSFCNIGYMVAIFIFRDGVDVFWHEYILKLTIVAYSFNVAVDVSCFLTRWCHRRLLWERLFSVVDSVFFDRGLEANDVGLLLALEGVVAGESPP